jgi:PAS domain-containing protein
MEVPESTARGEISLISLLTESFTKYAGTRLVPAGLTGTSAAQWLYYAPFGLLAQDAAADPRFIYANLTAQRIFEYDWDEFVGIPSRLSAEGEDRDQRQVFMQAVLERGYASGYQGMRVGKSGRRFWIQDVTVWNLTDDGGVRHGQAAMIPRWSIGGGTHDATATA